MTADDDLVTRSLALLSDGGLDDAELDRRVIRFRAALGQLRDDPAEAARIDALVMDAECGQPDPDVAGARAIYVNGGVVHVYDGRTVESAGSHGEGTAAAGWRAARTVPPDDEIRQLIGLLEKRSSSERSRPRGPWDALLRPAFGSGIFVVALAAGSAAIAANASPTAVAIVSIILAAGAAVTALLSLWAPWTSVRALNRRGDPYKALELLCQGGPRASTVMRRLSDEDLAALLAEHAAKQQPPAFRHCTACGATLLPGNLFCGNCGAPDASRLASFHPVRPAANA